MIFIPAYINHEGPEAIREYTEAQEIMFDLREEYDSAQTLVHAAVKALNNVINKRIALLEKYPTLSLGKKGEK